MKFGIRIDTVEDARRWVEVYVDGEPPDGGIDGPGLIPAAMAYGSVTEGAHPSGRNIAATGCNALQSPRACVSFHAAVDLERANARSLSPAGHEEVACDQPPGRAEEHVARCTPGERERALVKE